MLNKKRSFWENVGYSMQHGTGVFSWKRALETGSYGGINIQPTVQHKLSQDDMIKMGVGLFVIFLLVKYI